jgi:tetratricopeptide (TPR) repeat protein
LSIRRNDSTAWYNRGNALAALGRKEEAIASYDQALAHQPDYPEAWNNRGLDLSDLDRHEEAITSYDQAIQINPNHAGGYYNKACSYGLQSNVEAAISCLQQAIALDPECREAAKTDSDFDPIRQNEQFQVLFQELN